eukprot:m.268911 g.268911  ORF g.268911 m.268911 type:complete len:122 (+) comp15663_c3_seq2:3489-3854(+)
MYTCVCCCVLHLTHMQCVWPAGMVLVFCQRLGFAHLEQALTAAKERISVTSSCFDEASPSSTPTQSPHSVNVTPCNDSSQEPVQATEAVPRQRQLTSSRLMAKRQLPLSNNGQPTPKAPQL